jgi:hypothetical protein
MLPWMGMFEKIVGRFARPQRVLEFRQLVQRVRHAEGVDLASSSAEATVTGVGAGIAIAHDALAVR